MTNKMHVQLEWSNDWRLFFLFVKKDGSEELNTNAHNDFVG